MQVVNARQHSHFKMERFDFILTVCFISGAFSLYEYSENLEKCICKLTANELSMER